MAFLLNALYKPFLSSWTGYMIAFFFIITLFGIGIIGMKVMADSESFVKYYFLVMIGRLLLGIIFVTVGLYVLNENKVIFVTNFLILYLLYLGFEIFYIIAKFQSRIG
jgi:hypothetical protein